MHLILDNYSVHKRRALWERCMDNAVDSVFMPSYSSWLKRLERGLAALRYSRSTARPPQPRRAGRRDRQLHSLAQPASRTSA
ncbi:hypothetical protein [Nocardia beijingensis]